MSQTATVVIIGAGAAGMSAAISCRRHGVDTVICERLDRPGKKLLATGGGRCNCLNEKLFPEKYNPAARPLVREVLGRFGKERITEFFSSIGLALVTDRDGRVYPATNQAASVVRCLQLELERLRTKIEYSFEAVAVTGREDGFVVESAGGKKIKGARVIVSGGGKSYPALGSNGSCYRLVRQLGHRVIEPVPACVPLVVKDPLIQKLQGQRIWSRCRCFVDGKESAASDGELIFTAYGLSGTAVLDVSEPASIALNRDGVTDVRLSADLVPFFSLDQLTQELHTRRKRQTRREDLLAGILPNKFGPALLSLTGEKPETIASRLKEMSFKVIQTRGWNEAEFTAGGVDTAEVDPSTMESRKQKGIYLCGELLDVNGVRGGYNCSWAWASGYLAGASAAGSTGNRFNRS